ncbi:MAG: hypothetical protein M8861_12230 [marine benthic group bacterium]|nr:hypothetical protein [Gemmatimonadota bacterium]
MRKKGSQAGLDVLKGFIPKADAKVPDVSQWSVGMHVQHCCLATIAVCDSLVASAPPVPRSSFSLVTSAIFLTGRIPRGRGKSPEQAIPRDDIWTNELEGLLLDAERRLAAAREASPHQWFRHFAFGVLNRDRTLKFLGIHNRHHARIVQDILRA